MVSVDLDIKGIIGLTDAGSLDKEKCKKLLEKFDKKDFIEYHMAELEDQDIEPNEDDDDGIP